MPILTRVIICLSYGVIKQSSLTTKLRVVFDTLARTAIEALLNDSLMVGGTVIEDDLFSILILTHYLQRKQEHKR